MLDVRAPWRRRPSGNARHVPVRMHARRTCRCGRTCGARDASCGINGPLRCRFAGANGARTRFTVPVPARATGAARWSAIRATSRVLVADRHRRRADCRAVRDRRRCAEGNGAGRERETGAQRAPVRRIVWPARRRSPYGGARCTAGEISNAARTDRRRATTRRSRLAGCTAS
ncbi:hypothetical protein EVG18_21755 [Burkholderia pyrrocinia]|nr:hypothetical protein EVG18_21755 [Burkholderia pyrrocinia]